MAQYVTKAKMALHNVTAAKQRIEALLKTTNNPGRGLIDPKHGRFLLNQLIEAENQLMDAIPEFMSNAGMFNKPTSPQRRHD